MTQKEFDETQKKALKESINGNVSPELKKLLLTPYREQVSWSEFPNWARPNDYTEMGHEG